MKNTALLILSLALLGLGGCASVPSGPSVLVLPGSGKNFNEFRASDGQCRYYAAQSIGSQVNDVAVPNAVLGTTVGAVAGAAIGGQQGAGVGAAAGLLVGSMAGAESARFYGYDAQRKYDNAYVQCMYGSGHRVPVPASVARNMSQITVEPVAASNIPPPPPGAPPASPPPDYLPPPLLSR